jgi:hypothetical protein
MLRLTDRASAFGSGGLLLGYDSGAVSQRSNNLTRVRKIRKHSYLQHIARAHKRSPRAIELRLQRLGLLTLPINARMQT